MILKCGALHALALKSLKLVKAVCEQTTDIQDEHPRHGTFLFAKQGDVRAVDPATSYFQQLLRAVLEDHYPDATARACNTLVVQALRVLRHDMSKMPRSLKNLQAAGLSFHMSIPSSLGRKPHNGAAQRHVLAKRRYSVD